MQDMDDSEIREHLECPICYSISSPPIYSCLTGHIICKECKSQPCLTRCPICESPYSVPPTRNFFAEHFASKLAVKCLHHDQGCIMENKKTFIDDHEKFCAYRPIRCFIGWCNQMIEFKDYFLHMKGHQPLSICDSITPGCSHAKREIRFDSSSINAKSVGFECFGKKFLQWIGTDGMNIWIWVELCGTPAESQFFKTKLTVSDEKHPNPTRMTWEGQVHDIRMSAMKVYETGRCLEINIGRTLKNFFKRKEGYLVWNLEIDIYQKE